MRSWTPRKLCFTWLALATLAGCSAQDRDSTCIPAVADYRIAAGGPSEQPSTGSLRLDKVLAELQADLTVHVFNAPGLRVSLIPGSEAQAHARLLQGDIELTQALMDALSDEELYMALAHEAGHLALHANRTGCEPPKELQQQEQQADDFAVELALSANRDPQALARALRIVVTDEDASRAPTHPALRSRLEAITARTSPSLNKTAP